MWCSGLQPLNHAPVQTHTHTHGNWSIRSPVLAAYGPKQWLWSEARAARFRRQHFPEPSVLECQQLLQRWNNSNNARWLHVFETGGERKKKKPASAPPPTKSPLFSLMWPWKPGRRDFENAGDFFFLRFDRQALGLFVLPSVAWQRPRFCLVCQ